MRQHYYIYSKHFNTKSDIYVIPVERIANISNEPDIFDYETWFAAQDTGGGTVIGPIPIGRDDDIGTTPGGGVIIIDDPINITDPAQRTEYANLNFNPYKKKLDSSPIIRYLYTGREMNIETNDYYYRMRMMDSSVGRFGSKDPILYLNLYRYVGNNPMRLRDPSGMYSVYPGPHKPHYTYTRSQIFVCWSCKYGFPNLFLSFAAVSGGQSGPGWDEAMGGPASIETSGGGGADNPDYMQDINKCDKQESNCNNCCGGETAGMGTEGHSSCISACISSANECKRSVDEKYGVENSRSSLNIPGLWGASGIGWNCWDNSSTETSMEVEQ
ncbi:RHS repeat-associated core domain-containing protein [bacterium]|nr:RHS repeat-associated core domain-containing protein [bacterium]